MQKKAIKVLLLEDNAFDADILQEILDEATTSDISLVWIDRLSLAQEKIEQEKPDIALIDMNLPDSDGLKTLFKLQEIAATLPVIVLSGHTDEAIAIEAVQRGAQDYLVKGQYTCDSIVRSILYAIERKQMSIQMEEQYKLTLEAEQRLSAVLTCMTEGLCKINSAGHIIFLNAAAEAILGLTIAEAKGMDFHKLVHLTESNGARDCCAGSPAICALLNSVNSDSSHLKIEDSFFTRGAGSIPVEFSSSPLILQGVSVGSVICFRDIRDQKIAEQRVKEFYSAVSHELRTPLTSINGSLSLMENGIVGPIADDALDLVKVARESCDRLLRLISDLLDIKKIEEGQMELKPSILDPVELMENCIDSMAGYAVQSQISLVFDKVASEGGATPQIKGDRDRIMQVLLNLVSNAVKFSPPGENVVLKLGRGEFYPVRFSICDSGPGIMAADLDKLFQRFRQLDQSDARGFGGTGLGLSISKALVEQHGGRIGVDSSPGCGSTFWFEVPAC